MTKLNLGLTALGLCLLAGAAQAQDIRVPYGDLDLTRAEGARTFHDRAAHAAAQWCAEQAAARSMTGGGVLACPGVVSAIAADELPRDLRGPYRLALGHAAAVATQVARADRAR